MKKSKDTISNTNLQDYCYGPLGGLVQQTKPTAVMIVCKRSRKGRRAKRTIEIIKK